MRWAPPPIYFTLQYDVRLLGGCRIGNSLAALLECCSMHNETR
jgi:hypothetical protein